MNHHLGILRLQTSRGPVQVLNVYNPRTNNQPSTALFPAIRELVHRPGIETVVLGDFNLHHPRWGGIHVAAEPQAGTFLSIMEEANMVLANPEGAITFRKSNRLESTIDLAFLSPSLWDRLISCEVKEDWAEIRDHFPIRTEIETSVDYRKETGRYAIQTLDEVGYVADVKPKLDNLPPLQDDASPGQINERFAEIQVIL